MQELLTTHLTPQVLVQPRSSMGDTLACEIQVAFNYTAFSVSDISVFDKYQNTCLVCAHVYVGCDTVQMSIYSPEGNRCRKSKVRYDTRKYPVYVENSP